LRLHHGLVPDRVLLDTGPLRRSREFRLLFVAQLGGVSASQLTMVAVAYQIYDLTRSSLQVGAVSTVQLVPLILGALLGGSVGGAVDRRRILLGTVVALCLVSLGMVANAAAARPSVVLLYGLTAVAAGAGGVVSTVCNAAVPSMVESVELVAAYASMQVTDQLAMVAAPAGTGLLIGVVHLPTVYALAAIAYGLMGLAALRMSPSAGPAPTGRPLRNGLRYLRGRQVLQGVYLIDLGAMIFGLPRSLFPAIASSVFRGGGATLGLLYAAPGAGALVGALATGWVERVRRRGWAVILAVCVWGATIAVFGVVRILWLALVLLVVAGWADVVSAVLRSSLLHSSIPESVRHALASLQIAVVEGGPRLGDLEAGAVATLSTTEMSVVSGGLACIVGAMVVATLFPRFRRSGSQPSTERPASAN
jgi:predicted MFS family arabinose efflux permease